MRKRLIYILIFLFIVPVQAILLPSFSLFGVTPDLALIAIYLIGFRYGEVEGFWMGMSLGFLLDLFSVGVLGVNFLIRSALGMASGFIGRAFLDMTLLVNFGIIFLLSLMQDLVTYLLLNLVSELEGFLSMMEWNISPRAIYTAAVGTLCFHFFGHRSNRGDSQVGKGILFTPGRDSRATK